MRIGRVIREMTDEDRKNPFINDDSNRRFMISIFYPADESQTYEQEPVYLDLFHPCEEKAVEFFKESGADAAYISHFKTNVYNDAHMNHNEDIYPVMIYSPAFGIERDMYLFNIGKLVQHGFIVVTVGATYESVFTVFPDGEFIKQLNVLSDIKGTDFAAWENLLNTRTKDITYLLNWLPELNKNNERLKGKMNLERIGVIGHFLGGAAVFRVARKDARIKAAILLDASLHLLGENSIPIEIPFLMMRQNASNYEMLKQDGLSETIARDYINGQKRLAGILTGYKSFIKIHGANHITFSDVPLHFNEPNIFAAHDVINKLTAAFLKEFVSGQDGEYTNCVRTGNHHGASIIDSDGEIAI